MTEKKSPDDKKAPDETPRWDAVVGLGGAAVDFVVDGRAEKMVEGLGEIAGDSIEKNAIKYTKTLKNKDLTPEKIKEALQEEATNLGKKVSDFDAGEIAAFAAARALTLPAGLAVGLLGFDIDKMAGKFFGAVSDKEKPAKEKEMTLASFLKDPMGSVREMSSKMFEGFDSLLDIAKQLPGNIGGAITNIVTQLKSFLGSMLGNFLPSFGGGKETLVVDAGKGNRVEVNTETPTAPNTGNNVALKGLKNTPPITDKMNKAAIDDKQPDKKQGVALTPDLAPTASS